MISTDATLLATLRATPVHLPAGELGRQLGLSTAAIAERVAGLQAAGFELEQHPSLGYRLLQGPDQLVADDVWSRLAPDGVNTLPGLVREILVLAETRSTNDVAAQLGRDGVPGGALVLAEKQTAGRGRFGRRWESAPYCGLWMSLLLRPEWPLAHWPRLGTCAAVAVAECAETVSRSRALIKWPNDVHLLRRKTAGILLETGRDARGEMFVVLGLGLNVNHTPEDFPPELREQVSSLREAAGSRLERAAVLVTLLQRLHEAVALAESQFAELVAEAESRSALRGQWIQARSDGALVEGVAEALDGEGRLLVRDADGRVHVLGAGEVTLRGAD